MTQKSRVEKKRAWWEFDLFDDESTRKKHTVMSKWEVALDDGRNQYELDMEEEMEGFLQFGKKYRVTVEEIGEAEDDAE